MGIGRFLGKPSVVAALSTIQGVTGGMARLRREQRQDQRARTQAVFQSGIRNRERVMERADSLSDWKQKRDYEIANPSPSDVSQQKESEARRAYWSERPQAESPEEKAARRAEEKAAKVEAAREQLRVGLIQRALQAPEASKGLSILKSFDTDYEGTLEWEAARDQLDERAQQEKRQEQDKETRIRLERALKQAKAQNMSGARLVDLIQRTVPKGRDVSEFADIIDPYLAPMAEGLEAQSEEFRVERARMGAAAAEEQYGGWLSDATPPQVQAATRAVRPEDVNLPMGGNYGAFQQDSTAVQDYLSGAMGQGTGGPEESVPPEWESRIQRMISAGIARDRTDAISQIRALLGGQPAQPLGVERAY